MLRKLEYIKTTRVLKILRIGPIYKYKFCKSISQSMDLEYFLNVHNTVAQYQNQLGPKHFERYKIPLALGQGILLLNPKFHQIFKNFFSINLDPFNYSVLLILLFRN